MRYNHVKYSIGVILADNAKHCFLVYYENMRKYLQKKLSKVLLESKKLLNFATANGKRYGSLPAAREN